MYLSQSYSQYSFLSHGTEISYREESGLQIKNGQMLIEHKQKGFNWSS